MGDAFIRNRTKQRIPKYTYTGSHELIDDGNGNWRIKLKSSGTLTFTSSGNLRKNVDIFLVGGGAGGVRTKYLTSNTLRTYGGGGYTSTKSNIAVAKGTGYSVTIGGGGAGGNSGGTNNWVYSTAGGQTTIVVGGSTYSANGGGRGGARVVEDAWGDYYVYSTDPGSGGSAVGEFGVSGSAYSGHKTSGDTAGGANTGTGGYGNASGGSGIVIIRNHR